MKFENPVATVLIGFLLFFAGGSTQRLKDRDKNCYEAGTVSKSTWIKNCLEFFPDKPVEGLDQCIYIYDTVTLRDKLK